MLFKACAKIRCSKLLLCVVKKLLIAQTLTIARFNVTHQYIEDSAHCCRFHGVILTNPDARRCDHHCVLWRLHLFGVPVCLLRQVPQHHGASARVPTRTYLTGLYVSLRAATGLYYLAELVEEYTKLAKRIITYSTQGVLILHLLVLVIDRLPLKCVAAGVAAHLCYLGQLKRYPFMQLWSPVTAGSIGALLCCQSSKCRSLQMDLEHAFARHSTDTICVNAGFLILSNVLWGMHFWRDSWQSLEYIFGFLFLTTWIVPFSLFLSVTANESVLPGGANASRTFSSSSSNLAGRSG